MGGKCWNGKSYFVWHERSLSNCHMILRLKKWDKDANVFVEGITPLCPPVEICIDCVCNLEETKRLRTKVRKYESFIHQQSSVKDVEIQSNIIVPFRKERYTCCQVNDPNIGCRCSF